MLHATIERSETTLYCANWWPPEVSVIELVMKSVVSVMGGMLHALPTIERLKQYSVDSQNSDFC